MQEDLRSRFPRIAVEFIQDEDGAWMCRVADGLASWGEVGTWLDDADEVTPDDIERLLLDITSSVADNLWPDELTVPVVTVSATRGSSPSTEASPASGGVDVST